MYSNSRARVRSIAAATALGIALATGTIGASPALAQPTPVSNIDFKKKGSVTVHKRDLGNDTTVDPTGNENPNAPGSALEGSEFVLFPVTNADLTSNAGFAAARALTPATAELGARIAATGVSGAVHTFDELPVGLYLLRETTAPAGYTPAADSLVFVPMTNYDDRTEWNYDIHVYPKNSKTEVVKEVEDAGQHAGDTLRYTITSDIPNLAGENTTISKYVVQDDLDETRLADPVISIVITDGTSITQLAKGTDYELEINPDTLKITATFTETGLKTLTDAKRDNASVKVVTTIDATITEIGEGSGVIENEATVISNNGGGGGDTTTDSNEVESYFGKLRVNKSGEDDVALAGAVFELYECTDQDSLGNGPLTVGGEKFWTTNNEGTFTIDALHVTDFEDGKEITPDQKYCLVETKAPEGYELLPEPVEINFTRAAIGETSNVPGDDAVTLVAEIENIKTVAPELPLTGGAGIGLLAGFGAAIVGAGAWVARRLNKA